MQRKVSVLQFPASSTVFVSHACGWATATCLFLQHSSEAWNIVGSTAKLLHCTTEHTTQWQPTFTDIQKKSNRSHFNATQWTRLHVLYSFFWVIPRLLILCANVSKHSVCSIFVGSISCLRCLDGTDRQSVLKRWHIQFRCQGITQKQEYNIQNMAKVWNQEQIKSVISY
jgi:hypothetical protein